VSEYALRLSDEERARYRFMAETALRTEGSQWAAAGVREGAAVADVGCGPGAVSVVLAGLVGGTGHIWAVDGGPEAVELARQAVEEAGAGNVTVSQGDATATGLAPASVDVVMIRHVLAHNGGREAAIVAHAADLVRPGGSVFLVDIDASAMRVRPEDPDLADLDERYKEWHGRQGNDLSVGLRLGELVAGAGLEVVEYEGRYQIVQLPPGVRPPSWAGREAMMAAGLATPDDVARWDAAFHRVDQAAVRPTVFVPLFSAVGRRPA
jgi:ubiquinone/menaquinone biosynthesis C-methylase UbiE